MGNINISRVILGGLVAGLVLNAFNFLANMLLFQEQMAEDLARLGLEEPGVAEIVVFVILSFLIGIVLVWLYAAIRPRLGASVQTAIVTGLVAWFFASLIPAIYFAMLGLFPAGQMTIGVIYDVIVWIVSAIAGAWLYQESTAQSSPASV